MSGARITMNQTIALVLLLSSAQVNAAPQDFAFTYQGELRYADQPIDDQCDLVFSLYDAATGGAQVGVPQALNAVNIAEGLFTAPLDFGDVYDGTQLYLQIAIGAGCGDAGAAAETLPRTTLTSSPYSSYALTSALTEAVDWSNIANRPAGLDDGDDDTPPTSYAAGTGLTLSGNSFSLIGSYRLPQGCGNGQIAAWSNGAWTCADPQVTAGDSHWQLNGASTYYNAGNVGIGTSTPGSPLSVLGTDSLWIVDVSNDSNGNDSSGLYVQHQASTGRNYAIVARQGNAPFLGLDGLGAGVLGVSDRGSGVSGWTFSTTPGSGIGVSGTTIADLDSTVGVFGRATGRTASTRGVMGSVDSPTGYAGYFEGGRNYFEGKVGIGTTNPAFPLHVESSSTIHDSTAVYGLATDMTTKVHGLRGDTSSPVAGSSGVVGLALAATGQNYGVFGRTNSPDGYAGYFEGGQNYFEGNVGIGTADPFYPLVVESNNSERAVSAINNFGLYGVYGSTSSNLGGAGVFGRGTANSGSSYGVEGWTDSVDGVGVQGYALASSGSTIAMAGYVESPTGYAGYFSGPPGSRNYFAQRVGIGDLSPTHKLTVFSVDQETMRLYGPASFGVGARSNFGDGDFVYLEEDVDDHLNIHAEDGIRLDGDVEITGTLSKGSGSFKIDHPLDPKNKFLYHSFVESPDMMNVYNGNVVLDDRGEAVVSMPDWLETLNRDFRYQLTAIAEPGPNLYIAEEMWNNGFKIAGGSPGAKVSWQITGIRQDPFANANRIQVEKDKPTDKRGLYLHPEAHGVSTDLSFYASDSLAKKAKQQKVEKAGHK